MALQLRKSQMKTYRVVSLVFIGLLAAGSIAAQQERIAESRPVLCPSPINVVLKGTASAPAPDPVDLPASFAVTGSQWNQTAINKHFGHTFRFASYGKECCVITSGTLTVTVKALEGGPRGSSTSANDSVNVISHGTTVSQQSPWLNGVSTGATQTLTFSIPANVLATGQVSFYVQDDTAVVSADLRLEGCCIRKVNAAP